MVTTVKAPQKKKVAPTKSLIRYSHPCLEPKDGYITHPLYLNDPDKLVVFPKSMFEIHTGLEIAFHPTMVLVTHLNLISAVQIGGMHFGYQKELVVRAYNLSDSLLELDPYQMIGSVFLSEIQPWK